MHVLINSQLKTYPLLRRFLNDPNQEFTGKEMSALVGQDYSICLTDRYGSTNLIMLLSILNRVDAIRVLSNLLPQATMNKMLMANDYDAFRLSASHGHIKILTCLVDIAPDMLPAMIEAGDYFAFRSAASYGHIAVINLLATLATDRLWDMIKARDYRAFIWAASYGHVEVVMRLATLAPDLLPFMVAALEYEAFRWAAIHGYVEVIICLATLKPDMLPAMIAAQDYAALRSAATHGHLAIVNFLLFSSDPKTRTFLYENYLNQTQRVSLFKEHLTFIIASNYLSHHLLPELTNRIWLNAPNRISFFKDIPMQKGKQLESYEVKSLTSKIKLI